MKVYTREQLPQQWAATQNNLGVALQQRGGLAHGRQAAQYLEQSVAACRAALEIYTREQLPQQWAAAQSNSGNALEVLGERASEQKAAQYLEQSAAAYRAALEVRTREQLPWDWATTQLNLGMLLRVLGVRASGEQAANYFPRQSEEALENPLTIFTPQAAPYQNRLARAVLEKAKAALPARFPPAESSSKSSITSAMKW